MALGVLAAVLSASRTGFVIVLLLSGWGLSDLPRRARVLLVTAPVVYSLSWLGMAPWAELTQHAFSGPHHLAEANVGGLRVAIWRDTFTHCPAALGQCGLWLV